MNTLNDGTSNGIQIPKTLNEAMEQARLLLTEEDIKLMAEQPVYLVIARLHLTLGYQIRNKFGLWLEESSPLLEMISKAAPEYPVFDADSASAALITLLWNSINNKN